MTERTMNELDTSPQAIWNRQHADVLESAQKHRGKDDMIELVSEETLLPHWNVRRHLEKARIPFTTSKTPTPKFDSQAITDRKRKIIAFLKEHPASTIIDIQYGTELGEETIHAAMKNNPDLFIRGSDRTYTDSQGRKRTAPTFSLKYRNSQPLGNSAPNTANLTAKRFGMPARGKDNGFRPDPKRAKTKATRKRTGVTAE